VSICQINLRRSFTAVEHLRQSLAPFFTLVIYRTACLCLILPLSQLLYDLLSHSISLLNTLSLPVPTTGKFRIPFLRGKPDPSVEHFRSIEQSIAESLDNWLCNAYLEVRWSREQRAEHAYCAQYGPCCTYSDLNNYPNRTLQPTLPCLPFVNPKGECRYWLLPSFNFDSLQFLTFPLYPRQVSLPVP
jgi:hypothetical protein